MSHCEDTLPARRADLCDAEATVGSLDLAPQPDHRQGLQLGEMPMPVSLVLTICGWRSPNLIADF